MFISVSTGHFKIVYKYDYKNPAQQRIAVTIKLGIALALAKEVNGYVLNDNNPEYSPGMKLK